MGTSCSKFKKSKKEDNGVQGDDKSKAYIDEDGNREEKKAQKVIFEEKKIEENPKKKPNQTDLDLFKDRNSSAPVTKSLQEEKRLDLNLNFYENRMLKEEFHEINRILSTQ